MARKRTAGPVVYVCENPACDLGEVGRPGRFTGGQTDQGAYANNGPNAPHGDGVCPNCGQPAKKEKT